MEYIIYNEMPYRKITYNGPPSKMGRCGSCGRTGDSNNSNNRNNTGAICLLIVILIIIIIIALCFLFCRGNGSYQYQKNGFQASPKANKDFIDITKIFQNNENPTYSEIKNTITDMDPAKYNNIMKNKHSLRPEMFDTF